jgi:MFS family permease
MIRSMAENPTSALASAPATTGAPQAGQFTTERPRAVRTGLVLALVLAGQFMALLDVSIVNVASATIRTDLGASGSALELVISGYTIMYAVFLITGARLGERWGYSRVFQLGVAVFTLASLACGLAPTVETLIGFRLLQGLGAAAMVPQVMSLIQRTYVGADRVRALGVYTAVVASGMVVGQVLGGILVTADLFGQGWRPIFLLNVPIGATLLVLGARNLPRSEPRHRELDLAGLVTLSAAVFLFVVPLVLGHDQHWPLWGWLMMAGSVVCLAAFALVQRRIAARGGSPLIHGRVLRSPGFAATGVALFLIMAGVAGFMFSLGLHLQAGRGESALRVGLTFGPMAAGFGLAGLTWRRLPVHLHPKIALPALLLTAAGFVVLGRAVNAGDGINPGLELMMLAMGALSGCAYGQLFASAFGGVQVEDAADASGVMVTLIQLGNVVGVAAFGTLFLSAVTYPITSAGWGHAAELATFAVAGAFAAAALVSRLRTVSLGQRA